MRLELEPIDPTTTAGERRVAAAIEIQRPSGARQEPTNAAADERLVIQEP